MDDSQGIMSLTKISSDDAVEIAKAKFMKNRMYWTASSTYNQGACGVEKAAKDLGYDVATVTSSFATVGVSCSGGTGGGGSCANKHSNCYNWPATYCAST